jgi:hypothetical protein
MKNNHGEKDITVRWHKFKGTVKMAKEGGEGGVMSGTNR